MWFPCKIANAGERRATFVHMAAAGCGCADGCVAGSALKGAFIKSERGERMSSESAEGVAPQSGTRGIGWRNPALFVVAKTGSAVPNNSEGRIRCGAKCPAPSHRAAPVAPMCAEVRLL